LPDECRTDARQAYAEAGLESQRSTMKLRIFVLTMALCASAWAGTQTCTFNGVDLGCSLYPVNNGTVTSGNFASPIGLAYELGLSDVGNDEALIYNHPNQGTLGEFAGSFSAYVPGSETNGSFADLAPYMELEVYPAGDTPSTYALIIVANSGFDDFTNDAWYTDGIEPDSTVHIQLEGAWADDPSLSGITNPDWLTCCSDLPTLSELDSTAIPGGGTWGDLLLHGAVVGVGTYGGSGGPYTAYVSGFDITTPEPSTAFLFVLGIPLFYTGRFYAGRRYLRRS
jgi:hypothetical protein